MKQHFGIVRALALKLEVLLVDEPFSSLDELTAKTLKDLILAIWRKPGEPSNSLKMVSHNVEEAVYMADRVIVISNRPGKVIGDVKIGIPRPRSQYLRDPLYFRYLDEIMEKLNLCN
jgi:NitT/TauT family transport system ATP-binding protein